MPVKSEAKKKIEKLHHSLKKDFSLSTISEKNYNYEFSIKKEGDSLKVQVYFGKKGVKVVLQGNTETPLYSEINSLISDQPVLEFVKQELDEPEEYIGTDESGKGDYFGPLVVAAVYVNKETLQKLQKYGVRDSKDLSPREIFQLAEKIYSVVEDNYSVEIVTPTKYNALYDIYKNLNKMLSKIHSKVIENVSLRTGCKRVIVDQFSKSDLAISRNPKFSGLDLTQVTKGERFTAVAAASIIARDTFDRWFFEIEKKGLPLLKGASAQVEFRAAEIFQKYGGEIFTDIAKLHFKTTKKIKGI